MGASRVVEISQEGLSGIPDNHMEGKPEPGNPTYDYIEKLWKVKDLKALYPDASDPNSNLWGHIGARYYNSLFERKMVTVTYQSQKMDIIADQKTLEDAKRIFNDKSISNFDAAGQLIALYKLVYAKSVEAHIKKIESKEAKPPVPEFD